MRLNELRPARGARKKPKRVGRGPGSGHGKTSTKGHKGQLARAGGPQPPGFEGGQMPLIRRVPKRGFVNPFRTEYSVVNLASLDRFDATTPVGPERMRAAGLVRSASALIKILGDGAVTKALLVQAHKFSQTAMEKIKRAGGRVEVIAAPVAAKRV